MARKWKILISVIVVIFAVAAVLVLGYKWGQKKCEPYPQTQKGPANFFTLRLNVTERTAQGLTKQTKEPAHFKVEWRQGAERLAGKTIWVNGEPQGLPLDFSLNCPIEVVAKNGQAIIEMGREMIGPETAVRVWPYIGGGAKFVYPPRNPEGWQLPLITTPGKLESQIRRGMSNADMDFVITKK